MEVPYARALKRAKGEDDEWNERRTFMNDRILRLVKIFKIGDNGEKAIAIAAQCSILAHEMTAPDKIIGDMKEAKALLHQAQKDRESVPDNEI